MGPPRRPRIGITTYHRSGEERLAFSLPSAYVDAVRVAGGIPVLLPPGEDRPEEVLEGLDGIVFGGGGDLDPSLFGGQVHAYNNFHQIRSAENYLYSWGIGVESRLYAESNAFSLPHGVDAADLMADWGGTAAHISDTMVNGRQVDLLEAYNADHETDLGADVGWEPVLYDRIDDVRWVPWLVGHKAGAGRLIHGHWGHWGY